MLVHSIANALNATELFALKWLIFTSVGKKRVNLNEPRTFTFERL